MDAEAEVWLELWAWVYLALVTLGAVGALLYGICSEVPDVPYGSVGFVIGTCLLWFLSVGIVPLLLVIVNISTLLQK